MTNAEICDAIHALRNNRQKHVQKMMVEYDADMHFKISELRELCTHGQVTHRDNGIGHYWSECVYCGKATQDD
jgi:hypothetical protein